MICGDLIGTLLALLCIVSLRRQWRGAYGLVWFFVVFTMIDLGNAFVGGVLAGTLGGAKDVVWLTISFYVPALWVTTFLMIWQLRRGTE